MPLTVEERRRLARMAAALRPSTWSIDDLESFIWANLKHHRYADVAVALAVVGTDAQIRDFRQVMNRGPWWKVTKHLGGASQAAPAGHPQCQVHKRCTAHEDHPIGADRCPDCRADLVTDPARIRQLREEARTP